MSLLCWLHLGGSVESSSGAPRNEPKYVQQARGNVMRKSKSPSRGADQTPLSKSNTYSSGLNIDQTRDPQRERGKRYRGQKWSKIAFLRPMPTTRAGCVLVCGHSRILTKRLSRLTWSMKHPPVEMHLLDGEPPPTTHTHAHAHTEREIQKEREKARETHPRPKKKRMIKKYGKCSKEALCCVKRSKRRP